MRFKVGDKVRMTGKGRSWFCSDVGILAGRSATVESVDENDGCRCPYYIHVESFGRYFVSPDAIEPEKSQAESKPTFKFGDKVRVSRDWARSGAGKENEQKCHSQVGVVLDTRCSEGAYEVAFSNGDSWYIKDCFLEPVYGSERSCPADACCQDSGQPEISQAESKPKEAELSVSPTGAVRSKDADNVRYDLITPIGLDRVAVFAKEYYEFGESCDDDDPDAIQDAEWSSWHVGAAAAKIYQFLGNDSGCLERTLSFAFLDLCWAAIGNDKAYDRFCEMAGGNDYGVANFELIPSAGMDAVARACHEGAVKYGDWNWERGFEVNSLLNHALKHIYDWLDGDRTEDHLGHAMWNVLAAIHSYILWPHLNEGRLRGPGCTPPRKEVVA